MTPAPARTSAGERKGPDERARERISKHCASANADSERQRGGRMSEPLLAVDGVVAGYGGGDVLRGVTFDVPEGSVTCVVGPNGAGKSTVMRVISGLLKPRLGTVTLRGERLNGKSP